MTEESCTCWRTIWEPKPDITPYEIALDMKYVNASQVVGSKEAEKLGTALRHRVLDEKDNEPMPAVFARWNEYKK